MNTLILEQMTAKDLERLLEKVVSKVLARREAAEKALEPDMELTRPQAAKYAAKSISTIQNWERDEILKAIRKGPRTVRYLRSDVDTAIAMAKNRG